MNTASPQYLSARSIQVGDVKLSKLSLSQSQSLFLVYEETAFISTLFLHLLARNGLLASELWYYWKKSTITPGLQHRGQKFESTKNKQEPTNWQFISAIFERGSSVACRRLRFYSVPMMELENIVANTVYLKAREGNHCVPVVCVFNILLCRFFVYFLFNSVYWSLLWVKLNQLTRT